MYVKSEFSQHAQGLSDLLLYFSLVEDGILYQSDGALSATWTYEGPDMDTLPREEAASMSHHLAGTFNLGEGWMVETNAMRREVREYLPRAADCHPVGHLIDREREGQFLRPGALFRTQKFITLTHLPPMLGTQRIADWFGGKDNRVSESDRARLGRKSLEHFKKEIDTFESGFRTYFNCERLRQVPVPDSRRSWRDDRLLRYLRECVIGEDFPFAAPRVPVYLNALISAADFVGGDTPMMNGQFLKVLAVDRYPAGSWPGMFRDLDRLPFPYRWHTRTILFDPEVSRKIHERNGNIWKGAQRGIVSQLFNLPAKANGDAVQMEKDAEEAVTVAGRGLVQFGAYNIKVILMSDSEEVLRERIKDLQSTIKPHGFAFRVETTNAVDAWRGALPGHGYSDVRVAHVHTENFADGMPSSTPYTGRKYNPSSLMPANTPALLKGITDGDTPLNFHTHQGDAGHQLQVGPTRHGKSTLLGLQAAQWLTRYPNGQVFAFDKKASMKTLCHAFDGQYYALGGPDQKLKCAPLADLSTDQDRAWAANWIETLCRMMGMAVTSEHSNCISEAITVLGGRRRRSLTNFLPLLGRKDLQEALMFYTMGSSASGGILDGETDGVTIDECRFCLFETDYLFGMDRRIMKATLPVLFQRINKKLHTSKPTFLPIDEAWMVFTEDNFIELLRSWLKELAKTNAVVALSTQNLTDFFNSPLRDIIIDQCFTKIYLATPSASEATRPLFEKMGLNQEQIRQISEGIPRRDYFLQNPEGFRRFELKLGQVAVALIGSNSDTDQEKVAELRARYPGAWVGHWLRHKKCADWAAWFDALPGVNTEQENEVAVYA